MCRSRDPDPNQTKPSRFASAFAESESNHPPQRPLGGLLFGFAHGHAWLEGARVGRVAGGAWHGSYGIFIAQTNIHYAIWHG